MEEEEEEKEEENYDNDEKKTEAKDMETSIRINCFSLWLYWISRMVS